MRPRSHLLVLGVFFLCVQGPDSRQAAARPGGGQNYRASDRGSSSSSSSSSSSRGNSTDSYRSSEPENRGTYRPGSSSSVTSYDSHFSAEEMEAIRNRKPIPDLTPPPAPPKGHGMAFALLFCLFCVGVLLVYLVRGRRAKRPVETRPTIRVNPVIQERSVDALKERDASFDAQAFTERTRAVVAAVNKAWLAGDMGPARRLISDGVFVRFTTQLQLLSSQGLRNAMADWRVVSTEILAADCDDLWDTVHVKIVGAARDLDLPLDLPPAEADKRLQRAALCEYDEAWSFVRRRGKHSHKGAPALAGQCPSCGAELPLSEVVRCDYCKALVNSGEHDWVLAEITQAAEWRAGASVKTIPGLDALRERDPSLSRQELEDRVSVDFWKWVEARCTGKPDKLARFCMKPPQDDAARRVLALSPSSLRAVAVGSADLKRVDSQAGTDQATLEVRWSAAEGDGPPVHHRHLFILGRAAEARSQRGLSSLDCPSCGGPLASSDEVNCRYCGIPLTGGKHEWALVEVRERTEEKNKATPKG